MVRNTENEKVEKVTVAKKKTEGVKSREDKSREEKEERPQRRQRTKKEVIYPVLAECSLLIKDEFWKQFYEDLSLGKSTKGIYITNGNIHTSNKRNGFTYNISDKDPEVILTELHHLLLSHTSIHSCKDINRKRQIIDEIEEEFKCYDKGKWTSIKRKNIRSMCILNYAISLRKKYDLTWPATINAYRRIVMAFEYKTHNSKDVEYSNGVITNIDDIEISEDGKEIINKRDVDIQSSSPDLGNTGDNNLQTLFEPYCSNWYKVIS